MLNLTRLAIFALPVVVQCFFLHYVDFGSWLLRLVIVYVIIGGACFFVIPEQLYNGMGLSSLRWIFEKVYPNIALANGSLTGSSERSPEVLLCGHPISELHGKRVKLKWHGSRRYLCITSEGWGVTGDSEYAANLLLQRVFSKEKPVPDTYQLRISEPGGEWHQSWVSFQPVNHLKFGGWLGAYTDQERASPYKLILDSSCPSGTFKLLCAWTGIPPPTQRHVTGFYIAEQLCGGLLYIGHSADRDAAFLEFEFAQ